MPMFNSYDNNFHTYLKYYEKTISASSCRKMIQFQYCPPEDLFAETSRQQDVVDIEIFKHVRQCQISLPELRSGSIVIPPLKLSPEIIGAEYFLHAISSILSNKYHVGPIELPIDYNNPYSEYGCSINDMCLTYKSNFKCAGVMCLYKQTNEAIDESDSDDGDETVFDATSTTDEYAEQQTIKEMMRNAGDLAAKKILLAGNLLQNVIIYELTAKCHTGLSKMLKLIIDFDQNQSHSYCTTDTVSIGRGLNWLLNCINAD